MFLQEFDSFSLTNLPKWDNETTSYVQEVIGFIDPTCLFSELPISRLALTKLTPVINQWRFIPLDKGAVIDGEKLATVETNKENEVTLKKGVLIKLTVEAWYQIAYTQSIPEALHGQELESFMRGLTNYALNWDQLKETKKKEREVIEATSVTSKLTPEQQMKLIEKMAKENGLDLSSLTKPKK